MIHCPNCGNTIQRRAAMRPEWHCEHCLESFDQEDFNNMENSYVNKDWSWEADD